MKKLGVALAFVAGMAQGGCDNIDPTYESPLSRSEQSSCDGDTFWEHINDIRGAVTDAIADPDTRPDCTGIRGELHAATACLEKTDAADTAPHDSIAGRMVYSLIRTEKEVLDVCGFRD